MKVCAMDMNLLHEIEYENDCLACANPDVLEYIIGEC